VRSTPPNVRRSSASMPHGLYLFLAFLWSLTLLLGGCHNTMNSALQLASSSPTITSRPFGYLKNGDLVTEFSLSSGHGVTTDILTWGGIIRTLMSPDKDGHSEDITLGYETLSPYEARHPYFGTITGRVANRIAHGRFTLDSRTYSVAINNGPNHLHGGINGFDRKNWSARTESAADSVSVILTSVSPDGDEGYPGEVSSEVRYTLTSSNELRIDYTATTSKPSPINLTSHGYFNLAGQGRGDIRNQMIQIHADRYLPVDETLIPIGEQRSVRGTPFDFRTPHPIGSRIDDVGLGYDHTFVIRGPVGTLRRAAIAWDPQSGRSLEVWTDQPGIQLYTGNYLAEVNTGKSRTSYSKHGGFCLEAQGFPDAINQSSFPSVTTRPGETYRQTTVMKLGIRR
jgi:aldose 1-epimerase